VGKEDEGAIEGDRSLNCF